MRITAAEARPYFDHRSQRVGAMIDPADLHDNGLEYWALDGICGVFHQAHWPDVWMVHYGAKPEAWGRLVEPSRTVLRAFWDEKQPDLLIGWTKESNRQALAFARRVGFRENGRMNLPEGAVVMQEWRPA